MRRLGTLVCSLVSLRKYLALCVNVSIDTSLMCHLFAIDLVLKSLSKSLSLCMMDPVALAVLAKLSETDWHFTTI